MAFERGTGKSAGTVIKYNGVTIPGWKKIKIEEKGRPKPEQKDVTGAEDSAYNYVDDPLGGKGSPNATVTLEGLLSSKDKADGAAGILQFAVDAAHTLVVTLTAGGDEYTLNDAVLKTFNTGEEVADLTPYTMTLKNSVSAGAWGTDS